MWWHTVSLDKQPIVGLIGAVRKPAYSPQWGSTMQWQQHSASWDLDIIEKPDGGPGTPRRRRGQDGSRPRTATGGRLNRSHKRLVSKEQNKRPGSAPALLRTGQAPARATMDKWGAPEKRDAFRQRMEDRAVADNMGRFRVEHRAMSQQFKDVDMLADPSVYDLLLLHNQSQRNRRSKPSSPGHSSPASVSHGRRAPEETSSEKVRSLARQLDRSTPASIRKKSVCLAATTKPQIDESMNLLGHKLFGSFHKRITESHLSEIDPMALPVMAKIVSRLKNDYGTISNALKSLDQRRRNQLGKEEWILSVQVFGLNKDEAQSSWEFLPRGEDDLISLSVLEDYLHLYEGPIAGLVN